MRFEKSIEDDIIYVIETVKNLKDPQYASNFYLSEVEIGKYVAARERLRKALRPVVHVLLSTELLGVELMLDKPLETFTDKDVTLEITGLSENGHFILGLEVRETD